MQTKFSLVLFLVFFCSISFSQSSDSLFVAFWNVENLFDVEDDPVKDDTEFLPSGDKEWTYDRLQKKFFNLSRVIRAMNNEQGPDILGVCEVEHQHLLDTLIANYLPDMNYQSAYAESPDNRGIDNGLIFNSDKFSLIDVAADTVNLADGYPTRVILNVNLLTKEYDTLRVFVNHWPSRRGGEQESEIHRIEAASTVRKRVDGYFSANRNSNIIVMGDFNDEPLNNSVLKILNAYPVICDSLPTGDIFNVNQNLFNLSYAAYAEGLGSYKYRDNWNMLDQIIVSGNLLIGNGYKYLCGSFEVFRPDFMVTQSGAFEGTPFPTYGGRRYLGGYSDHFPVTAIFIRSNFKR